MLSECIAIRSSTRFGPSLSPTLLARERRRASKVENVTLPEFSPIRLTSDRYLSEGVGRGAIGVILDVFDDGYIVEFSRPDGTTIAWFGVELEDVEPAPKVMRAAENATIQ